MFQIVAAKYDIGALVVGLENAIRFYWRAYRQGRIEVKAIKTMDLDAIQKAYTVASLRHTLKALLIIRRLSIGSYATLKKKFDDQQAEKQLSKFKGELN